LLMSCPILRRIEVIGIPYGEEVLPGDDVGKIIVEAAAKAGIEILDGDIIVVSHKVVSKAEGRVVDLRSVEPSEKAVEIARRTDKDPRLVEVVLREAAEVLKVERGHIITLTRHGIVCANSGVDQSNAGGQDRVVLLPLDPDESARKIRRRILELTGRRVAVIISDTYGRPFRLGVINLAIGFAGINPFRSYVGKPDRDGYIMRVTQVAVVDEIAAAAELVIGQGRENTPFAIVRSVEYDECEDCGFRDIYMRREDWLFR